MCKDVIIIIILMNYYMNRYIIILMNYYMNRYIIILMNYYIEVVLNKCKF
jgi:hypothetical protein